MPCVYGSLLLGSCRIVNAALWLQIISAFLAATAVASMKQRSEYRGPVAAGAIIFVHGLGGRGDASFTANNASKTYWPTLIKEDIRPFIDGISLSEYDTYTVEYDARCRSSLQLSHIIANMVNDLSQVPYLLEYRHLVFVAHSLGGVVTQSAVMDLLAANETLWSKVSGLLFLASPGKGSGLASVMSFLCPLSIYNDIGTSTSFLNRLEKQWRDRTAKSAIRIRCAHGTRDPYVKEAQLHSACDEIHALDFDHPGIAKPISQSHGSYEWVESRVHAMRVSLGVDADLLAWNRALKVNDLGALQGYLASQPLGRFKRLANLAIADHEAAAAERKAKDALEKAAEKARAVQEEQRREAERRREEAKRVEQIQKKEADQKARAASMQAERARRAAEAASKAADLARTQTAGKAALYRLIVRTVDERTSKKPDTVGYLMAYTRRTPPRALAACIDWNRTTGSVWEPGIFWYQSATSYQYPIFSDEQAVREAVRSCRDWCPGPARCHAVDVSGRNTLKYPASWLAEK